MTVPIRALVIAIEDYPNAQDIAPSLAGTNDAAERFIDWLKTHKGVPDANIRYCAAEGRPGRTAGTLRADIAREAKALADEGRDQTRELYVFFSGHGFSFKEGSGRKPSDILVTSDFTEAGESGGACIRLRELQEKLQMSFGPGEHYYFIDACRNLISEDDIEPTKLGVKFTASLLGIGTLYTLYSTAPQTMARVDSGFSKHLVEGLRGKGRAKGWVGKQMYVTFDLLRRYVQKRLPGQDADMLIEGSGDGYIIELKPVPKSDLHVRVLNAEAQDTFTAKLDVEQGDQTLTLQERSFQGPEARFSVSPGDYALEVRHHLSGPVRRQLPSEGASVDAYDACEVVFEKQPPPAFPIPQPAGIPRAPQTGTPMLESLGSAPPPPFAAMRIRGPGDTQLELTSTHDVTRPVLIPKFLGTVDQSIPPGNYQVKLTRRGRLLSVHDIDLKEGMALDLDLGLDLEERIPSSLRALRLETTVPIEERTPALLLSLLGAGRITTPDILPERVRNLPLQDFAGVKAGESRVYVLAFFEHGVADLRVGLGGGGAQPVDWRSMQRVRGVDGLWEGMLPAPVGPALLSVERVQEASGGLAARVRPQQPLTYVTHLLPDRVTLVTLTQGEARGGIEFHQYLLPLHDRLASLPYEMRSPFDEGALRFVQALWEIQHEFALKRTLETSLDASHRHYWEWALYGKWVDPTLALFAGYELLRRRRPPGAGAPEAPLSRDVLKSALPIALDNLRRFFAGIPDTELLAKLAGLEYQEPRTPPLILDGLLAWDSLEDALPLSSERLTYEGPWVVWRNAVPGPATAPPAAGRPPSRQ